MQLLLEALDQLIMESEDFSRIFDEVRSAALKNGGGAEKGGGVTQAWLAGMVASRGSSAGKLSLAVSALEDERLDPDSKAYRDAVRIKSAFEVLHKYGMVERNDRGRYTFPVANTPAHALKRNKLSKFRNFLTSGFNADKVKQDTGKNFRQEKSAAIQDVLAAMPEATRMIADKFSKLSRLGYTLLTSLWHAKGPKAVSELRHRTRQAHFNDQYAMEELKELGFLNSDYKLNRDMVTKLIGFLNDSDTATISLQLNPDLASHMKRTQHDAALAKNATAKDASKDSLDDDGDTLQPMSDEERDAKYSRIRDIDAGTKNSNRNQRAGDYKRNWSDMLRNAF
jgi:hypothetical protein